MPADLPGLIHRVRTHPGVAAKAEIGLVSDVFGSTDWLAGPGDDGAVVPAAGTFLVVGGEAILPSFVAADPHGAGIAAVTTNLNDLAAMGAWPLALVDTVTGPRPVIQQVLEGMRWASGLYQVPVVGGHLTVTAGPPGLSAFGLGRTDRPLAARAAEPGQSLVVACCVEGRMRADFPFFPSFDERGEQLGGDVRLLAEGARDGWVVAAKDVSMAGLVGSLAMLLECNRLGVTLEVDSVPVPARVSVEQWLCCFPCFAFLLCVPAGEEARCLRAFAGRGLAAAVAGTLDDTGLLRLRLAGETATAFDLGTESVTNLARSAAARLTRAGRSASAGAECRRRSPARLPGASRATGRTSRSRAGCRPPSAGRRAPPPWLRRTGPAARPGRDGDGRRARPAGRPSTGPPLPAPGRAGPCRTPPRQRTRPRAPSPGRRHGCRGPSPRRRPHS